MTNMSKVEKTIYVLKQPPEYPWGVFGLGENIYGILLDRWFYYVGDSSDKRFSYDLFW